jgi:hypothetical protein
MFALVRCRGLLLGRSQLGDVAGAFRVRMGEEEGLPNTRDLRDVRLVDEESWRN